MNTATPRRNQVVERARLEAQLEAQARVELCEAFRKLREEYHLPVVASARALGVSPSTFSGRRSLCARYRVFGVAGLVMRKQPPRHSKIAKLTRALRDGAALAWDGNIIAALP